MDAVDRMDSLGNREQVIHGAPGAFGREQKEFASRVAKLRRSGAQDDGVLRK